MKGFLGTGATFGADLNLVVQLIMGVALAMGAVLARQRRYRTHGICHTTVLLLNLLMIGLVMWPSFQQQVKPALSKVLYKWYYEAATIHAVLGITAELLGLYIVLAPARTFFHSGYVSNIGSGGCARNWCFGRLFCSAVWERTAHGT
jgi:Ca2+/H+ antiporter